MTPYQILNEFFFWERSTIAFRSCASTIIQIFKIRRGRVVRQGAHCYIYLNLLYLTDEEFTHPAISTREAVTALPAAEFWL